MLEASGLEKYSTVLVVDTLIYFPPEPYPEYESGETELIIASVPEAVFVLHESWPSNVVPALYVEKFRSSF